MNRYSREARDMPGDKYSRLRGGGWSHSDALEIAKEHVQSRMGSSDTGNGSPSTGNQQRCSGHSNHVRSRGRTTHEYGQNTPPEPLHHSTWKFGGSYRTEERQPQEYTPFMILLSEFIAGQASGPQTYTNPYTLPSVYNPTFTNHSGANSYTFPSSHDNRYTHVPRPDPRPASAFDAEPEGTKPTICLYKVLGVSKSASTDEVKKAYRKMSLKWHPDRAGADKQKEATAKMARINHARDVLVDRKMRRYYDRTGYVVLEGLA